MPTSKELRSLALSFERQCLSLKLDLSVVRVVNNRGFLSYICRVDSPISEIRRSLDDLSIRVGRGPIRLTLEPHGFVTFQVTKIENEPVLLLSTLIDRVRTSRGRYSAVLGESESRAVSMFQLTSSQTPHVLISGTTGSGKTWLSRGIVLSLCDCEPSSSLGIVYFDPKIRETDPFIKSISPWLLAPPAQSIDDQFKLLLKLVRHMDRLTIPEAGVSSRVLIYIDELADFCIQTKTEGVELLTRIAQKGREYGIHIVAATQKPTSASIGPQLKSNLPLRLVGRVSSPEDAKVASGIAGSGAERLTRSGQFLAILGGRVSRFTSSKPDLEPKGSGISVDLEQHKSTEPPSTGDLVHRVQIAVDGLRRAGAPINRTRVTEYIFGQRGGPNWVAVDQVWDIALGLSNLSGLESRGRSGIESTVLIHR